MRRCLPVLVVLLALVSGVGPGAQAQPGAGSDRIDLLMALAPPAVRMENGELVGYWIALVKLVTERAGVTIDSIQPMPYVRSLAEVAAGDRGCTTLVARTPEREANYSWVAPTRRQIITTFVRADDPDPPRNLDDLRKEGVQVVASGIAARIVTQAGIKTFEVIESSQLAKMLIAQRFVIYATDYGVGFAAAKQAGIAVKEAVRIAELTAYFACSPRLPDGTRRKLAAAFRAVFLEERDRELSRRDGLDAIYDPVRPDYSKIEVEVN
jgi:polar amino acid transport system substrate-binding protein